MKPLYIPFGALLLWLLSGCSVIGISSPANQLGNIRIEATANCNNGMPVAIDFLFIQDDQLAKLLGDLSGPDWFARKYSLMRRYDQQMSVSSVEIVPLSIMPSVPLPDTSTQATSILMFANYLGLQGQFVAELGNFKQLFIQLQQEGYRLTEQQKD
ncbi:hypothetical protein [Oceanobacter mangrovi]|uniref:hypothetical protein n=1 Tax=Oceanobacter mangrovi TaxID=2862510 RepID=UPI001C8DBAF1|nr:hypothetical protein [Oceanobacter mangrovi]